MYICWAQWSLITVTEWGNNTIKIDIHLLGTVEHDHWKKLAKYINIFIS